MTVDWQVIKRAMAQDDAGKMAEWLDAGELTSNDENGLGQRLLNAACAWGAQAVIQLLKKRGAEVNPADPSVANGLNSAIEKNQYTSFVQLLAYGADIERTGGNFANGNALGEVGFRFARKGSEGVKFIDRLVLAGGDLSVRNARGALPLNQARGGAEDVADVRMEAYMAFETLLRDQPEKITHAALFDEGGYANMPGIWRHFHEITEALAAHGETISREDLLTPRPVLGRDAPQPPVLWLVISGQVDTANAYLDAQSEDAIGTEVLLGMDKQPTALMQAIGDEWACKTLFASDLMGAANHHDLRAIYHAVPELQRSEVGGFHQLLANATRNERGMSRGGVA